MNKKGFNFKKVIIESEETNDLVSAFISIDKYKQNKAASTTYISPKENYVSTEFDTSSPVISNEVIIEKEPFNSDNFIIDEIEIIPTFEHSVNEVEIAADQEQQIIEEPIIEPQAENNTFEEVLSETQIESEQEEEVSEEQIVDVLEETPAFEEIIEEPELAVDQEEEIIEEPIIEPQVEITAFEEIIEEPELVVDQEEEIIEETIIEPQAEIPAFEEVVEESEDQEEEIIEEPIIEPQAEIPVFEEVVEESEVAVDLEEEIIEEPIIESQAEILAFEEVVEEPELAVDQEEEIIEEPIIEPQAEIPAFEEVVEESEVAVDQELEIIEEPLIESPEENSNENFNDVFEVKDFKAMFALEKTIIFPKLGAFTLTNVKNEESYFMPYLKHDDGKIVNYIAERDTLSLENAKINLSNFIADIIEKIDKFGVYVFENFGSLQKNATGEIEFDQSQKSVVISKGVISDTNNNDSIFNEDNQKDAIVLDTAIQVASSEELNTVLEDVHVDTSEKESFTDLSEEELFLESQRSELVTQKEDIASIKEQNQVSQINSIEDDLFEENEVDDIVLDDSKMLNKSTITKYKKIRKLVAGLVVLIAIVLGGIVFMFLGEKESLNTPKVDTVVKEKQEEKSKPQVKPTVPPVVKPKPQVKLTVQPVVKSKPQDKPTVPPVVKPKPQVKSTVQPVVKPTVQPFAKPKPQVKQTIQPVVKPKAQVKPFSIEKPQLNRSTYSMYDTKNKISVENINYDSLHIKSKVVKDMIETGNYDVYIINNKVHLKTKP